LRKTFEVVDMFCGAGGESTGIMQAAVARDMKIHLTAINHWEMAIRTHAANHPSADHLCQSVEHIDPTKAVPGKRVNLLWASPECTHHSVARGGRPRSDQSRASAWLILKWLSDLYVERVIIENVPEFLSWGPLDNTGRPIQNQKGKTFRAFMTSLRSLGYTVDWKILCAADYGDPTTRRRLFIQAVKGRKRIVWPQITHMDGGSNLLGCQPWRPVKEIIDWAIPGTSIFDRKRPLAPATMRRIAAGIEKYWGGYARPFLAILRGTGTVQSIDDPLTSITTSGAHHALVEPVPLILGQQSCAAARPVDQPIPAGQQDGENRNHEIERPIPTLDTSNRYGLVSPLLVEYHGTSKPFPVDLPIKTITCKDRFALMEPFVFNIGHYSNGASNRIRSVNEPLSTVVTKAEHCLIEPGVLLDIRFRMLKPHELKQGQGFPKDYIILGNVTEQVKQIGNAVPPGTAEALSLAAMSA
jgi:DNA (cytosine-5)-methyltransferase 1